MSHELIRMQVAPCPGHGMLESHVQGRGYLWRGGGLEHTVQQIPKIWVLNPLFL